MRIKIDQDIYNKLKEKSLSRIYQKTQEHECGTITAFRSEYSKAENQQRNKSLLAKLQAKRYGITSVKGYYVEDFGTDHAHPVGEHIFFVEDRNNTGNLKEDLKKLGLEFDQDSILFFPLGGKNAELIGTSKREDLTLKFNEIMYYNRATFGKEGQFMTKVQNRPFVFASIEKEFELPQGYFGRLACQKVSEVHWSKLEL